MFIFDRHRPVLAAGMILGCLLLPSEPGAGAEGPSELDRLRATERTVIRVIENCRAAFVFIPGGSGFVISEDGYVLTNNHVVLRGDSWTVVLAGGRAYRAELVGRDRRGDVALLKLQGASGLPCLELGDSDRLRVGQPIVALGDPFLTASANIFLRETAPPTEYEPIASFGIVSALHRYSDAYGDAIQVDLAVNRGNSGGPLLTLGGKVVGINGKIETRFVRGINTGVGYAVPSSQIRRFLEPLKAACGGVVLHGTIKGLQVDERAGSRPGLPVTEVTEGSPAGAAGFQPGDLIVSLGGFPVTTRTRYLGVLSTYPAGQRIPVQVARGDRTVEIAAVLLAEGQPYLGIAVGGGLTITKVEPGSPALSAKLQVGDVIREFAGRPVASSTELAELIQNRHAGEIVGLSLEREGKPLELEVQLGARE
jgi:serine protease Do